MIDKSGRHLGPGDLVVCFRNKKRLEEMEYAIVVAEGKVYNGSMTYTVNNNSYKCALTEQELIIQNELYEKYFKKTNNDIERKNRAKNITEVGQIYTVGDETCIFLGKCKINETNTYNYDNDDTTYNGYLILKFRSHDKNYYRTISKQIVDSIEQSNSFDINLLNSYSCGYGQFNIDTQKSKPSVADSLLGICEIKNWNIGSKLKFKVSYAYIGEFERLK